MCDPVTLSARCYVARGWPLVRIPFGQKAPRDRDWQKNAISTADAAERHLCGQMNIGVLLGTASGGLVDVDLDCPEACAVADKILPSTAAVFGRASKPRSHWLYYVGGPAPSLKFSDPLRGDTLVELRGDKQDGRPGYQTVFPPSIHPSGEPIEWVEDGEPAFVDCGVLRKAVVCLAIRSLCERYCPGVAGDAEAEIALDRIDQRLGNEVRRWKDSIAQNATTRGNGQAAGSRPFNGTAHTQAGSAAPNVFERRRRSGPLTDAVLNDHTRPAWSEAEEERVRSALAFRDASGKRAWDPDDNRDIWSKQVAAAIASLNWGEKGEDIYIWFSRQTTKEGYFPGDEACRREVRSYKWGHGPGCITEATIYKKALDAGWVPLPTDGAVRLDDFSAYMPTHSYIFRPTGEMWTSASVDARIRPPAKNTPASRWLDRHRPVEQMTWAPGLPTDIKDQLIAQGGWFGRAGCTVLNLYRPPVLVPRAGPIDLWREHLRRLYGGCANHIERWLAHRVQRPGEKINHALVLGGLQGIGKDTLLEPVKRAVGPWNFQDVSPKQLLGRFNGFLKSVILRVSEARDLGEFDRFAFYDHTKVFTAAPPDVLRVDEKHVREYYSPNVVGVIITTNHKTDGIFLPADDRRHYVAWSDAQKEDFTNKYWNRIWQYYEEGGYAYVAHHLATLDLSEFDPKAPPPKTEAFWEIVNASHMPETAELADALDKLERPDAVTLDDVKRASGNPSFMQWLEDRKNARRIPHRFEECGYVRVRNPDAEDGFWRIGGRRQAVYTKQELTPRERIVAARKKS
jgi:hypothetical protein